MSNIISIFFLSLAAILMFITGWSLLVFVYKVLTKPNLVQVHRDIMGTPEQIKNATSPLSVNYPEYQSHGGAIDIKTGEWIPQTGLSQRAFDDLMK
jgi:hypothetical protein